VNWGSSTACHGQVGEEQRKASGAVGVWRCSGLLYIGQGQGGGQPSGGIMAPVNARHSLPISVSR
jgi:hypothetical protein